MTWRRRQERWMKVAMMAATSLLIGSFFALLTVLVVKGWQAISWSMVVKLPTGGAYFGGEGGILNAIVGSLLLAVGATSLSLLVALPTALLLQPDYAGRKKFAQFLRSLLDGLWGVPSIVYGACGYALLVALGWRACLLGGLIALAFVELPIMVRAMDEALGIVPKAMKEAAYALAFTRYETMRHVVLRQALPSLVTAVLLAFGRGIGDAASVLFTAGYTDNIPRSLFDPVASLPLTVFFLLNTPFEEGQRRAYAAAFVLLVLVLAVNVLARVITKPLSRYIVR
ncbi:MAG: hypothetical protein IMHGJWDQ_001171 [Candidatus Fervidibacter sp.]